MKDGPSGLGILANLQPAFEPMLAVRDPSALNLPILFPQANFQLFVFRLLAGQRTQNQPYS